ncbi:MAG: YebC/PmpR family DNA-binding transcriptional regulator, partial [Endomicrobiaceae bacterium]|nr:YebC/PmpR family DNA-binding transcriptional regulator [Endomicrobiaceae bacterium]
YGPAGVALIVETTTDNKNRTSAEMRKIFSKHSGNLGESGCVGWMFSRKGYISVDKSSSDEDTIMTLALENGAEDFSVEDEIYEIYTKPEQTEAVKNALTAKNIPISNSEVSMIPQTYVKLTGEDAEHMIKLMDELEEYDDVKNVFANFDISKEDMEKFSV